MAQLYPPLNDPPLEGDLLAPTDGRPRAIRPRFIKTWQQFFAQLRDFSGNVINALFAQFVLTAANGNLPNARVLTSTPTVAVDLAAAGQVRLNVPDHAITYVKIQNVSAGPRVLGAFVAGTVGEFIVGPGLKMTATTLSVNLTAFGFAPLATGAEPMQLISDGAGQPIMVPFTT